MEGRGWTANEFLGSKFLAISDLACNDVDASHMCLSVFCQPETGVAESAARIEYLFARHYFGQIGQNAVQVVKRLGVALGVLVVITEMHRHIAAAPIPHGAVVESCVVIIGVYVRVLRFHAASFGKIFLGSQQLMRLITCLETILKPHGVGVA